MQKRLSSVLILMSFFILTSCGENKKQDLAKEKNPTPQKQTQEANVTKTNNPSSSKNIKTKKELEEIFKKGGKITCNMETNEGGVTVKGIFYIDNKKVRADFKSESKDGIKFEGHSLTRDGFNYNWNKETNYGIKTKFEEDKVFLESDNTTSSGKTNEKEFNCIEGVDGGDFNIPQNVNFQETNFNIPDVPK